MMQYIPFWVLMVGHCSGNFLHIQIYPKGFKIPKISSILLFTSFLILLSIYPEQANALPSVTWEFPNYGINEGDGFFDNPNLFTVDADNPALVGNGLDTLDVLISSSTGNTITLTLNENPADDGTFTNSILIFTHGAAEFQETDTVTITVEDSCANFFSGNCNPNTIDTLTAFFDSVVICSTSDQGCISFDMTETGPNTSIFTGILSFSTTASDPASGTIKVAPGDVLAVFDLLTGAQVNGLIVPSPGDIGSIPAEIGGTVTATFNGISSPTSILDDGAPGRGGGGAVRPGLVLNFIASSGMVLCEGDCIKPTLGLDNSMNRIVENGFSYNGNPVDVEDYYTPYPLITTNIGQENVAVLKIYENGGPENIKHLNLAFGLSKTGQSISESKAIIMWEKNYNANDTVKLIDPENALQDVRIETSTDNCNSTQSHKCLILSIFHTFRQSLNFNIVGTDVWDFNLNSKTNFYNEGIEIIGESLNPPKVFHLIDSKGFPHVVTLTSVTSGFDEEGKTWKLEDNFWIKEFLTEDEFPDPIPMAGLDRHNNLFTSYMNGQRLLAQELFNQQTHNQLIKNPDFYKKDNYESIKTNYDESKYDEFMNYRISMEIKKAEDLLSRLK